MGDDEAVEQQQPPSDEGDENTGAVSQPADGDADKGGSTSEDTSAGGKGGDDTSIFGGP